MAKSALEKWFDKLEDRTKKAIKRQVSRAARSAGQTVARGARAAVEAARVKPHDIVADMRAAGWTPKQIQQRTGVPVRTQNDILKGRSNGQKHFKVLKEARKAGGRKAPPAEVTPVKSARKAGEGILRHTKAGTTITVTPGTDPKWVAEQQRQAAKHGTVKVVVKNPPPRPEPRPKIDQSKFVWEVTDKDGRHRKLTAAQLKLAPGTLDKAAAALAAGDTAKADQIFQAGIRDDFYRNWTTPGSVLQQTGTLDGSGGGPEGAMTRSEADAEAAVMYDGDDGDSVIYEGDLAYEGDDSDSDYGGAFTGVTVTSN